MQGSTRECSWSRERVPTLRSLHPMSESIVWTLAGRGPVSHLMSYLAEVQPEVVLSTRDQTSAS